MIKLAKFLVFLFLSSFVFIFTFPVHAQEIANTQMQVEVADYFQFVESPAAITLPDITEPGVPVSTTVSYKFDCSYDTIVSFNSGSFSADITDIYGNSAGSQTLETTYGVTITAPKVDNPTLPAGSTPAQLNSFTAIIGHGENNQVDVQVEVSSNGTTKSGTHAVPLSTTFASAF
ncbi:MAG: hypothetical protein V1770_06720 [bacterium]